MHEQSSPSQRKVLGPIRKVVFSQEGRNVKEKVSSRQNKCTGSADGWPPKVLQQLGEVQWSLWHFKGELTEWKKIDDMLKKTNGSLGLFLD